MQAVRLSNLNSFIDEFAQLGWALWPVRPTLSSSSFLLRQKSDGSSKKDLEMKVNSFVVAHGVAQIGPYLTISLRLITDGAVYQQRLIDRLYEARRTLPHARSGDASVCAYMHFNHHIMSARQ